MLFQAGWKENLATFMNELKNLQCVGLTTLGAALKHALDVLNINRMQTGIDTYGQGRCPFYLEPSVIVVITDGGKYTTINGVHQDVSAISCRDYQVKYVISSYKRQINFSCSLRCRCIPQYPGQN